MYKFILKQGVGAVKSESFEWRVNFGGYPSDSEHTNQPFLVHRETSGRGLLTANLALIDTHIPERAAPLRQ